MKYKIKVSKLGCKFAVVPIQRPAEDDVAFFTYQEFEWMKKNVSDENEFKVLWLMKMEDHRAQIIPDKDVAECAKLAEKYGGEILDMLRGRRIKKEESA